MPRKPRVEFPGAFYHVIARGNHRQGIFRDEAKWTTYLDRFEYYQQRYNCTAYAYVLMSNHVYCYSKHTRRRCPSSYTASSFPIPGPATDVIT